MKQDSKDDTQAPVFGGSRKALKFGDKGIIHSMAEGHGRTARKGLVPEVHEVLLTSDRTAGCPQELVALLLPFWLTIRVAVEELIIGEIKASKLGHVLHLRPLQIPAPAEVQQFLD